MGRLDGSSIIEETVAGKMRYRARLQCGSVAVSGPVRWQRATAMADLKKMEDAFEGAGGGEGMLGVQMIQPELFRIRDRPS